MERVKIANFRSIDERPLELELKPLTILVGPNASGKSSIMFAIDWLAKRREKYISDTFGSYEIETYNVYNLKDFVFGRDLGKKRLHLEITFKLPGELSEILRPYIEMSPLKGMGLLPDKLESITYGFSYQYAMKAKDFGHTPEYGNYEIYLKLGNIEFKTIQEYDINKKNYVRKILLPESLREEVTASRKLRLFHEEPLFGEFRKVYDLSRSMQGFFKRFREDVLENHFFFLSSLRGWVEEFSTVESYFDVGSRGERLIKVLSTVLGSSNAEIREGLGKPLLFWLEKFGLLKTSAGISPYEHGKVRASYLDPSGIRLDYALASHGCRQIASVVTELIVTPKHSVIMIEEPEISLHPKHQTLLPLLFADVIKRDNKQVIISTHSSLLILSLMDAVMGHPDYPNIPKLDVKDIAVYHVKRDPKHEYTIAEPVELTPEGLPKEGIESFIDVEEKLLSRISKRLELKEET
nr:AAA family ATPase [Candidatus Baldrarchaeota archaeon]